MDHRENTLYPIVFLHAFIRLSLLFSLAISRAASSYAFHAALVTAFATAVIFFLLLSSQLRSIRFQWHPFIYIFSMCVCVCFIFKMILLMLLLERAAYHCISLLDILWLWKLNPILKTTTREQKKNLEIEMKLKRTEINTDIILSARIMYVCVCRGKDTTNYFFGKIALCLTMCAKSERRSMEKQCGKAKNNNGQTEYSTHLFIFSESSKLVEYWIGPSVAFHTHTYTHSNNPRAHIGAKNCPPNHWICFVFVSHTIPSTINSKAGCRVASDNCWKTAAGYLQ